ncbi:hypothetical protein GCM10009544_17410 [Streptomyces stramineus]|uniref:Uncharacterized protein n=1 Tax=Streptomyces stramineus TaxID=173861 RepID=A0ABN0ZQ27_9ACTN
MPLFAGRRYRIRMQTARPPSGGRAGVEILSVDNTCNGPGNDTAAVRNRVPPAVGATARPDSAGL